MMTTNASLTAASVGTRAPFGAAIPSPAVVRARVT